MTPPFSNQMNAKNQMWLKLHDKIPRLLTRYQQQNFRTVEVESICRRKIKCDSNDGIISLKG